MIRRLLSGIFLKLLPVLVLVTLGTSMLVSMLPGDPAVAILGPNATADDYARVRDQLGLDLPVLERYAAWLSDLFRGDLGTTLTPPTRDVADVIMARIPVTLELTVLATVLALVIAVPVGLWSAYRFSESFDKVASMSAYAVISMPSFLLGLLLILVAVIHPNVIRGIIGVLVLIGVLTFVAWAIRSTRGKRPRVRPRTLVIGAASCVLGATVVALWPDLPSQGFVRVEYGGLIENLRSLLLPALTLALIEAAQLSQVLRSDAAAMLREDFVLASRAKGMPLRHILVNEVLRPSSFSLVTVAGISFGRLLGGTVIVETLFRLPGMGTLIVQSVTTKDFAVLQASVLLIATFYVVVNTLVDLSYSFLDPRVRRATS